jgi:hypothetical protein
MLFTFSMTWIPEKYFLKVKKIEIQMYETRGVMKASNYVQWAKRFVPIFSISQSY